MQVIAEQKATSFLAKVGGHLSASPIENNLLLGIVSSLDEGGGDPPLLVHVEEEGAIELVAVQTPPRPLVLSRGNETAVQRLTDHLASLGVSLPGVIGPREAVETFVHAWSERAPTSARLSRIQTLYAIGKLELPTATRGRLRQAVPDDEELLCRWSLAFQQEVGVYVGVGEDPGPFVRSKIQAGQLFVWEDGPEGGPEGPRRITQPGPEGPRRVTQPAGEPEGPRRVTQQPLCMAGWAARSPRAVRVNYVYTPPSERRKGHAGACVGALTKKLLDEGSETCLLFADAGNTTSNGVYKRLGYQVLCEFAQYDFFSK